MRVLEKLIVATYSRISPFCGCERFIIVFKTAPQLDPVFSQINPIHIPSLLLCNPF
jgi:hypothetical protein